MRSMWRAGSVPTASRLRRRVSPTASINRGGAKPTSAFWNRGTTCRRQTLRAGGDIYEAIRRRRRCCSSTPAAELHVADRRSPHGSLILPASGDSRPFASSADPGSRYRPGAARPRPSGAPKGASRLARRQPADRPAKSTAANRTSGAGSLRHSRTSAPRMPIFAQCAGPVSSAWPARVSDVEGDLILQYRDLAR